MGTSLRGPLRVMDAQAMGGQVFATDPVYCRGAEMVRWLVKTGGVTNYKLQWARAGDAWISPTDSPLNTADGTYPEWRVFSAAFEGGFVWDWIRLLFFGPAVETTETHNGWVFDTPVALTAGKYLKPSTAVVTTVTTALTLVEGEDYTLAADGQSITPIEGGQLTSFIVDGGLVATVFAIGEDEETTADAFVTFGAEPGTPTSVPAPESVAAATGEPPYAIADPLS